MITPRRRLGPGPTAPADPAATDPAGVRLLPVELAAPVPAAVADDDQDHGHTGRRTLGTGQDDSAS